MDLITITDAADQLGVATSTVWRWVEAGKLPHVLVGKRRFVPVSAMPGLHVYCRRRRLGRYGRES